MSEVVYTKDQLQQFGYGTCPHCDSDNGYTKHETFYSECFQCGDCGKWWKLSYVEERIYSELVLGDTHDEVKEKWQRVREGEIDAMTGNRMDLLGTTDEQRQAETVRISQHIDGDDYRSVAEMLQEENAELKQERDELRAALRALVAASLSAYDSWQYSKHTVDAMHLLEATAQKARRLAEGE